MRFLFMNRKFTKKRLFFSLFIHLSQRCVFDCLSTPFDSRKRLAFVILSLDYRRRDNFLLCLKSPFFSPIFVQLFRYLIPHVFTSCNSSGTDSAYPLALAIEIEISDRDACSLPKCTLPDDCQNPNSKKKKKNKTNEPIFREYLHMHIAYRISYCTM
jgi:hypothetical protein